MSQNMRQEQTTQVRVRGAVGLGARPVIRRSLVQAPLEALLIDWLSHNGLLAYGYNVLRKGRKAGGAVYGSWPWHVKDPSLSYRKEQGNPDSRRLWTFFGPDPIMP